jgi:hypothetical protein
MFVTFALVTRLPAMLASTRDAIGNVILIVFGVVFAGFLVVMVGSLVAFIVFRGRRWYRIVKDAGQAYDSDGLHIWRDPEHGSYYVRGGVILKPLPRLGTGWLTGDPKWCVAYNSRRGTLFITRRTRWVRRVPRRLRDIEDLEELRPMMEEIDRRQHPWRERDHDATDD